MIFGKGKRPGKVTSESGTLKDTTRNRSIAWLATYKTEELNPPVIFLSHGGTGSNDGYKSSLEYIRKALAEAGYVAISIQHKKSQSESRHLLDRPADVKFVLDSLLNGKLKIKGTFSRTLIGHAGHSVGSYTGMALAGGSYDQGTFHDKRFLAFASLSPQGPGEFGSKDDTWESIEAPVYFISGTEEDNKNGKGWRRIPFENSPSQDIKFWSLVQGMDHDDLGRGGTKAESKYVSDNVTTFFNWFFKGTAKLEEVGTISMIKGTEISNSAEE